MIRNIEQSAKHAAWKDREAQREAASQIAAAFADSHFLIESPKPWSDDVAFLPLGGEAA